MCRTFADVLDLEEYQHLKPEAGDYSQLIRDGFDLDGHAESPAGPS